MKCVHGISMRRPCPDCANDASRLKQCDECKSGESYHGGPCGWCQGTGQLPPPTDRRYFPLNGGASDGK